MPWWYYYNYRYYYPYYYNYYYTPVYVYHGWQLINGVWVYV